MSSSDSSNLSKPGMEPLSTSSANIINPLKQKQVEIAKSEIEGIVAVLDKLGSRFEKVESVEEALIFQHQMQLIKKIVERYQTEEEIFPSYKENLLFSVKQIQKQFTSISANLVNPPNSDLTTTLRAANRILSTPTNLLYVENEQRK